MQQHFEHSLDKQPIVVRQTDGNSDWLETNGGKLYPLVRVRNTVIDFGDIVSFTLSVGQSFLPKLSLLVDDSTYDIREQDFAKGIDKITIAIGNPQDQDYNMINNDYVITEIDASAGSSLLSFEAVLDVPLLYTALNSSWEDTTFNIMKYVAEEIGLGFVSNVSNTNDSMVRIRHGRNLFFIDELCKTAYKDTNNSFICFVDQFANLNFIDLKGVIDSSNITILENNIISGEKIEEPTPLLLTNNKVDLETDSVKISFYSPVSNYGAKSLRNNQNMTVKILETDNKTGLLAEVNSDIVQQSLNSTVTKLQSVNTYPEYSGAKSINKQNQNLMQGMYISATLDYYVPPLFMFGTFDVEIYNAANRSNKESQSTTDSLDDQDNQEPANESVRYVVNDELSGESVITEMVTAYNRTTSKNADAGKIRQSVMLYCKNQTEMDNIPT